MRRGSHTAPACQERIAPEDAALAAENGLGGDGGELIAQVGLAERPVADAGGAQLAQTLDEPRLIADATDDYRGVFEMGGQKSPGSFEGGMTGLHHLLGVGKVPADQDINVRAVGYLAERHGQAPFVKETVHCIASGGI